MSDSPHPTPIVTGHSGDAAMVYRALIHLVTSNSRIGFHNGDQGHCFYTAGANGDAWPSPDADSPERNRLYQMIQQARAAAGDDLQERLGGTPDVPDWQTFCQLAVEAHARGGGMTSSG